MTYEAAIQLIKQKQSLGVQPGLSRMLAAMEKTGSVQNKLQVIHVAGTNG
ncbi:MAG TPA: bifunctional folylpolyglutamate synthase/dihydrofolate synthase, partial [Ruminococcaceae bacterium]|nr:bifunctional folylpolyglutamate synthase/dihydrofolate synthase [Oscillospiraceae bacterium]